MHYVWTDEAGELVVADIHSPSAVPAGAILADPLPQEPQHQWAIRDGVLVVDPARPPKKTKDDAYWDAITAATTVAQLKAALLSRR